MRLGDVLVREQSGEDRRGNYWRNVSVYELNGIASDHTIGFRIFEIGYAKNQLTTVINDNYWMSRDFAQLKLRLHKKSDKSFDELVDFYKKDYNDV